MDFTEFNDEIVNEFFKQIYSNLIIYFQSIDGLKNMIKAIIDHSKNLNKTIKTISNSIGRIFKKYISYTYQDENKILLWKNFIRNEQLKNEIPKEIEIKKEDNTTQIIKVSRLKQSEKNLLLDVKFSDFEKFKEKNTKEQSLLMLKQKYEFFKYYRGESIIIPDDNGNKYIYQLCQRPDRPCNYVRCSYKLCKAKGKINKTTLMFTLATPHSMPYIEHKYSKALDYYYNEKHNNLNNKNNKNKNN